MTSLSSADQASNSESLRIRRFVPASPDRVFRAWTEPDEIKKWWGPKGVRCLSAEFDLRVGGQYRIENGLSDGSVLWISGNFEVIEGPHLLIYTWVVENESPTTERVVVQFEQHDLGTNVTVTHERIATTTSSEQHQRGWIECIDGLVDFLAEFGTAAL